MDGMHTCCAVPICLASGCVVDTLNLSTLVRDVINSAGKVHLSSDLEPDNPRAALVGNM